MLGTGILGKGKTALAIVLAAAVLSGCSTLYPDGILQETVVVETPLETIVVTPLARRPWDPGLPPVAIVLTNTQPAYADVAEELASRLDNYEVFDLDDRSQPPVSVLRLINDSNSGVVVAIGLRAAQSSVAMAEKPVIFSQVFNYQEHDLVGENSRGIAVLAPLDAQLAVWKKIDPSITRIGAIVGTDHDELMAAAEIAAEKHGIELRMQVTHSDQESLYMFRRMVRDIDGFWLFPDNRVLSPRVLREMLNIADRQQVPVAVPQQSMLSMGATISFSTVAADIAATIVNIIRQIQSGELDQVPSITQLSEIRVETNGTLKVVDR